ncbi:hypothetical protein L3X38_013792 [Prunus dulcis]|uniref:NAC domain-containing protein n=1 Tax=Prunus dulcis TaxID=3755 RepID=A0AAD4WLZ3_PRUDU|nr:hypothetical protein L3X38_013792 [Prunus dulcis]
MTSISVSVNGECKVPPGFRFQPTEEELLLYYLRKRVLCEKIDLDIICDIDPNKFDPWDIQGRDKVIYGNGRRIGLRKTRVLQWPSSKWRKI